MLYEVITGKLAGLEKQLKSEEERLEKNETGKKLLKQELGEAEIADVVARWTGVPVSKLMEGEKEKISYNFV